MDNFQLSAYPVHFTLDEKRNAYVTSDDVGSAGFTKSELASLMIAQGGLTDGSIVKDNQDYARYCVRLAAAVLEEANK